MDTGKLRLKISKRTLLLALAAIAAAAALTLARQNFTLFKDLLLHEANLPPFRFSFIAFVAHLLFTSAAAALVFASDASLAKAARFRFAAAAAAFVLLVAGGIHMSSIGMWDSVFRDGAASGAGGTLVGSPRGIRSDEWLVNTPYCLAQVRAGFPEVNGALRPDGQNMMIAPGLVLDLSAVFRPNFWGYYLFGAETGLSWAWCFPLILLALTSFELFRYLTKDNVRLSLLGTLWLLFSPPVQWWMQGVTGIIHPIVWSQAVILCFLGFMKCGPRQWGRKTLFAALFCISVMSFAYNLYPAWQIPFLYVMLALIGCIAAAYRKTPGRHPADLAYLAAALALVGVNILWFLGKTGDAVAAIQATVYPGGRVSTGGDVGIGMLLKDIAAVKLPYASPSGTSLANECEASAFIAFLPFVLLAFPMTAKRLGSRKAPAVALFALLLFQLSWILVSFPRWFGDITLMRYVPSARLMIPMGVTAIYLFALLISHTETQPLGRPGAVIAAAATALCYGATAFSGDILKYMGPVFAAAAVLLFTAIVCFACFGRKKAFAAAMCVLILISGATVNPVARGLGPITGKKVAQAVLQTERGDPGKKWIGLENLLYGPYLVALGIDTINGVHYYPDLDYWRRFDADGAQQGVYNRYAHVIVRLTGERTSFELMQGDVFIWRLNTDDIAKTGASYVLAPQALEGMDTQKTSFERIYHNEKDHVYIYRVIRSDPG